MALTVSNVDSFSQDVWGRHRIAVVEVTFDSSYPTGGESFTPADAGMAEFTFVQVSPDADSTAGYVVQYDYVAQKLRSDSRSKPSIPPQWERDDRGSMADYTFTGGGTVEEFVVPDGVTSIDFDVRGAQGGAGGVSNAQPGGNGQRLQGTLAVTPGETLYVIVGLQGGTGTGTRAGGYPGAGNPGGGGNGGSINGGLSAAGGGGGASEIRRGGSDAANRILVSGGGGGGSNGGPGGTTNILDTQETAPTLATNGTNGSFLNHAGGGGGGGYVSGGGGGQNSSGTAGRACTTRSTSRPRRSRRATRPVPGTSTSRGSTP